MSEHHAEIIAHHAEMIAQIIYDCDGTENGYETALAEILAVFQEQLAVANECADADD